MKLNLEINNTTRSSIKKDFFAKVIRRTLAEYNYDFLKRRIVSLSIALVAPLEIKKLNRIYRRKDSVTDILSFSEYRSAQELKKAVDKNIFLGELVMCYTEIGNYSKKTGRGIKEELARVVSHGLLHLLGLRHGKKMFSIQNSIIKKDKNNEQRKSDKR
ncbi:MAG: rRNA maturation RNase YbeY [Candidatus Moranbacteria bacterium]|nr:rRNA maturation RNase YbeY [Candidatus Moranbacteria bacterium]